MRWLIYMLRIRRIEFLVAEIPIILLPVLISVRDLAELRRTTFWEGVVLFFLLFNFGDMINCLADRELDKTDKPRLSEAVYGLGVRFVTFQVALTALLALAVSIHLALALHRWLLVPLVAVGLALGAAYSVEPFRLKRRGVAQLACLWLIIFVGPMILIALLFSDFPSPAVLALSATYGAIQMGIILVNTAEDYPEDKAASVVTTIVSLGLGPGIGLAFWLILAGGSGLVATLCALYASSHAEAPYYFAVVPTGLAGAFAAGRVRRLFGEVQRAPIDSDRGVRATKAAAKAVPVWLTLVAWSALGATSVLFFWVRA